MGRKSTTVSKYYKCESFLPGPRHDLSINQEEKVLIHPSTRKISSSLTNHSRRVNCRKVVHRRGDYGDIVSGMSFRIGAVLDGVGCRNLKTLELVQLPHELPDTDLPPATSSQVVEKDPPSLQRL